jgi:DNA-binding winged helix-turn-helix (wHTH) protein/TolB-like protein
MHEPFRIGDRLVVPSANEIDGVRVDSKAMDVLVALAKVAPNVVSTDDLLSEVWPNVVVEQNAVYQQVAQLRKALDDDARAPRYIENVPRRGYRVVARVVPLEKVAPVEPIEPANGANDPDANAATAPERPQPSDATPTVQKDGHVRSDDLPRRARVAALVTVALVLVGAFLIQRWFHPSSPAPAAVNPAPAEPLLDKDTIAVIPFAAPADSEELSYGLADEIRVSLNNVSLNNPTRSLRLVPAMSVQPFKGLQGSPQEIGRTLHAGSLLFGNVHHDGDQLKVTVWLVDANTGLQRWSKSYVDSLPPSVFELQARIAREIADQLVPTLTTGGSAGLDRPPTNDPDAYTEFLQARHMLHRRGIAPIETSIKLFDEAIHRDPNFGRAYVGLAEALIVAPSYTGEPETPMYDRATAALDHAERLGVTQLPAQAIRAYIDTRRWRWFDAAKEFAGALASDPNDSDLRQYYSQFLAYTGDLEHATEQARLATTLDPLSPIAHQRLGVMYLWVNDDLHASQEFDLADKLGIGEQANPEVTVVLLLWKNQFDEARARLIDIQRVRHKSDAWIVPAIKAVARQGPVSKGVAALRAAHAAGEINDRLYFGALLLIGDPNSFFSAIEDAVANRDPFDVEMLFMDHTSPLRRLPRFAALMEQLGLVKYWDANHWPVACARNDSVVTCH